MLFSLSVSLYFLGKGERYSKEHYENINAAEELSQQITQAYFSLEAYVAGSDSHHMALFDKHMNQAKVFEQQLQRVARQKSQHAGNNDSDGSSSTGSLIKQLVMAMQKFTAIAAIRIQNSEKSKVDRADDYQFNQMFLNIIKITAQLEDNFSKDLQQHQQMFERNNIFLLLLNVLLGAFALGVVIVADKRRRVAIKAELRTRSVLFGTEKILERSQQEAYIGLCLQEVQEASTDFVSMANDAGQMIYMNRAGREMVGMGKDEDISSFKIFDFHPEVEAKKFQDKVLPIVDREGIWKGETLFLGGDGREVLASQIVQAHKTISGQIEYYSTIARDISEERSRQGKMEHVQRLESLGVLAGGIAHDFNNLLTVIMGNAALVSRQLPVDSPAFPNVRNIEETSKRAADLCRQMLAYSGKGRFVVKPIIISELVEEMSQLLTVSIAKNIVLRLDLNSQIPAVDADVTQMQQVIMNLVINASEAIGKHSGIISIATGLLRADKKYLASTFLDEELDEGRYVYLEVSDTGCGMDEKTKDRIFEPFFTTKFTGRGLGMAAILGIVRGHHGAIKVYSEFGKGTTFKILFPCSEEESISIHLGLSEVSGWRGEGCILIVDDEETIREIAVAMLEDMGFETLVAADGVEGVEMFRTYQNKISAVLLDMTMPHMGGEDAFSEMCRIDPDVKVILSSGYTEQDATSRFAGKGLAGFLQKPYMVDQLAGKFKDLLDKPK